MEKYQLYYHLITIFRIPEDDGYIKDSVFTLKTVYLFGLKPYLSNLKS